MGKGPLNGLGHGGYWKGSKHAHHAADAPATPDAARIEPTA
jgi:hypothetical protein